jgi:hypothetical protein
MINDNCKFNVTISTLVWRIRKLLSLRLIVRINHTWRKKETKVPIDLLTFAFQGI